MEQLLAPASFTHSIKRGVLGCCKYWCPLNWCNGFCMDEYVDTSSRYHTNIYINRNSLKSHHINSLNIYHPRYKVPKPKLFLSQELHHSSCIYSVCRLQSVAAWSVNSSKAWGPDPSHQMPPFHRQGSNPRRTPYNDRMHHHLNSLFRPISIEVS
jgi:hypothetical protein